MKCQTPADVAALWKRVCEEKATLCLYVRGELHGAYDGARLDGATFQVFADGWNLDECTFEISKNSAGEALLRIGKEQSS